MEPADMFAACSPDEPELFELDRSTYRQAIWLAELARISGLIEGMVLMAGIAASAQGIRIAIHKRYPGITGEDYREALAGLIEAGILIAMDHTNRTIDRHGARQNIAFVHYLTLES